MGYPKISINLDKLEENVKKIIDKLQRNNLNVMGITKAFACEKEIVQLFKNNGINMVGDSRILNLKKIEDFDIEKVLIRIPMISSVEDVVKYSTISLNSELKTIEALNEAGKKQNKIHGIILMVELGDLREGFLPEELEEVALKISKLDYIKIRGIGTNFSCIGGIIPDINKINQLTQLTETIEKKLNMKMEIVSGGNSSSYHLIGEVPLKRINNIRMGEGILLGRETAFGENIEGCHEDSFILQGEIVEIKNKKTVPYGKKGMDAFGKKPEFKDRGIRKRAILAIGKQDFDCDSLYPLDKGAEIIGASSDHLVVDISDSDKEYEIGDIMEFQMGYGALLRGMTSIYIDKEFKKKKAK
ncbi:MAG: alanine/ornithine racemase family PLP-dependent enzyme [Cetobacterium sp.]|uniref:alanine/ornithine racemase family PLP-dependent enzyme n=1 Tax=Cetobacterium sp. TaxID=2071632 RepID=UPI003F2E18A0